MKKICQDGDVFELANYDQNKLVIYYKYYKLTLKQYLRSL